MSIFGWSLPPGCGTLPGEEPEPSRRDLLRQANGKRLLRRYDATSWGDLARAVYAGTTYGVTLGVQFHSHDTWVYTPMLLDRYKADDNAWPISIALDAIVEGVDECASTVIIDLDVPFRAAAELAAALTRIEANCEDIWQRTHGCWSCARRAGTEFIPGETPVHKDCPQCLGQGQIL